MSTTKKFLKSKPLCKVTFKLPKESALEAEKVALVGEFNNWDTQKDIMKKLKNGSFKVTIDLETGKDYEYRFLIDEKTWENDPEADSYVPNRISYEDNSVVTV